MDTLKLAWRNVWRNTRRSVVTITATALALFVMIVYSGLVAGYIGGMERKALALELGEVQIFAEDYRKKPSIYTKIEGHEAIVEQAEAAGFRASARLKASGLGAFGDASSGISINGIDVERDATVSDIAKHVHSGRWIGPDEHDAVAIGRKLAKTLGIGVGDELVVLSQGADGSMANEVYQVRGILKGISDGVDRGGVFMTHRAYRELMYLDEGVHQLIVRTPKSLPLDQATAQLQKLAPEADVKDWTELMPTLASMLENGKVGIMMMFVIIYIAIGILILNAMLMAVFERIREFGVLKAIGVGPLGVMAMIFAETAIQLGAAICVGVLLAIPTNHYLVETGLDLSASLGDVSVIGMAMDPIWRSEVDLNTYLMPIAVLTAIVGLAVIYPALKAAFVRPVAAMRHQ